MMRDENGNSYNDKRKKRSIWCRPSCIPVSIVIVLIVLVALVPLLDQPNAAHVLPTAAQVRVQCSDECRLSFVESIPEGHMYPPNVTHMPTKNAWLDLIDEAQSSIEIASYYWNLRLNEGYPYNSSVEGEQVFQALLNAGTKRRITLKIAQNWPSKQYPNMDSDYLVRKKAAQVRSLNFSKLLGGGVLHTKFWLVDRAHFYIGSANMDWRSLNQVKELGLVAYNCSCLAKDLGKIFDGHHATNLKNHLAVKHKDKYKDVININNEKENISPSNLKIDKTEERIKLNCLKIVTIHGRPFQYLEDEAFQDIINMSLNKKEKSIINIQSVKPMVADKAYEVRSKIASEVKGKLVSLKLDSATYMFRSFVGINLQFIKNGKITVRTLATKEVFDSQTGDYLKQILEEVLHRYRIDISQIYSITTDNGKNLKKMANLLGGSYDTIDENESNSDVEYESGEQNEGTGDIDLESAVEALTQSDEFSFKPRTMLCAAHTLQLSIKDAIQANDYVKNLLDTVRHIVRILRTPTLRILLKRASMKYPVIDCSTRWSSTYEMLLRFQSFKSVCSENEDIRAILNEESWQVIDDLVTCLQPLYNATKKLQKEQLTLGDFFVEWMACKVMDNQCRSLFANSLSVSMSARQVSLLKTPLMLEALYLDKRLNIILSDAEASYARHYLHQTYEQIVKIQTLHNDDVGDESTALIDQSITNGERPGTSSNQEPGTSSTGQDMCGVIEEVLKQTELERGLERQRNITAIDSMLQEIRTLPRLSSKENIITFWSTKLSSSAMAELALCVLAAPATQTSVERLFSSLKFILSPARTNLSPSVLEDIMVIRSNKDLFD